MDSPQLDTITAVCSEQFLRRLLSRRKIRYKFRKQIKALWARLEAEKKADEIIQKNEDFSALVEEVRNS